jgi:hypothetical protein
MIAVPINLICNIDPLALAYKTSSKPTVNH